MRIRDAIDLKKKNLNTKNIQGTNDDFIFTDLGVGEWGVWLRQAYGMFLLVEIYLSPNSLDRCMEHKKEYMTESSHYLKKKLNDSGARMQKHPHISH